MKKETTREMIIRKVTSRKLWMSICAFISLLVVALGHTEGEAAQVTALIMAGASVLSYILAEGWADKAGAEAGKEQEEEKEYASTAIGYIMDDDPDENEEISDRSYGIQG